MSARLIQVIETKHIEGRGVKGDPSREVTEYHLPDGTLIARQDPHEAMQGVEKVWAEYDKHNNSTPLSGTPMPTVGVHE